MYLFLQIEIQGKLCQFLFCVKMADVCMCIAMQRINYAILSIRLTKLHN